MNRNVKVKENKRDLNWENMYELAKAYYNYHGDLDIVLNFQVDGYQDDKITRLGRWIGTQREYYQKGTLSDERIKKLDSIGMIWKKKTTNEKYRDYLDYNDWNKLYELAKIYYIDNGNLDIPYKYNVDGYRLDYWISNQDHDYKLGKLSEDKKEKLENIGMIWSKRKKRR